MKEQKSYQIFAAILALTGLTALFLIHVAGGQKLGEPGVKVMDIPIMTSNGNITGSKSIYLPSDVPGYQSKNGEIQPIELSWLPKDTTFGRRLYASSHDEGFQALVSVVLMGRDRTSLHKPQYCLTGQGWQITKTEAVTIPVTGKHSFELRVMRLTASSGNRGASGNYVYWFVADGEMTPSHGERMWLMAKDLITKGVLQRWAYISYFMPCVSGTEEASFNRLKEFISITAGEIMRAEPDKLTLLKGAVRN